VPARATPEQEAGAEQRNDDQRVERDAQQHAASS
jgi:hypothetical protein